MVQATLWPEDENNNYDDYESSLEENNCPHIECEGGNGGCSYDGEDWDWKDCDCEECTCQGEEEDTLGSS